MRCDKRSAPVCRDIERGFYTFDVDAVRKNFSQWRNCEIIVGAIPETLPRVRSDRIAFLPLDLNCSPPEVAAIEALWDHLAPGAFVLLDDYAYIGYRSQKLGMDAFARECDLAVLSLPTGQGLIIKPAVGAPTQCQSRQLPPTHFSTSKCTKARDSK